MGAPLDKNMKILAMKPATCRPVPSDVTVTYFDFADGWPGTAIHRDWRGGDSGAGGNCKRCHVCVAKPNGKCQLVVNRHIEEDRAWDFSPADLEGRPGRDQPGG